MATNKQQIREEINIYSHLLSVILAKMVSPKSAEILYYLWRTNFVNYDVICKTFGNTDEGLIQWTRFLHW